MNNLLCISNTYELALRYLSYAHLFKKSYFDFDIWESFLTFESLKLRFMHMRFYEIFGVIEQKHHIF